jgi:hypothetical protein
VPVFWRRILIFVALWLVFEASISWLATCQPYYEQTANYSSGENHCTLFVGPLSTIVYAAFARVRFFLREYEHELIAGFTIVLAFSTVFLWLSTRHLWQATKDAAASQARDMEQSIGVASRSAGAAEQSAKAALEAIKINRAQIRAYIGLDVSESAIKIDAAGRISVRLCIINAGQSLARRVICDLKSGVLITNQRAAFPAKPLVSVPIDITR